MKICLTSDTHYGFSEDTEKLLRDMLAEIAAEKPDVLLHAGDWASTKQSELEQCLALFREYFPNTPIVGTFGNHDLWLGDNNKSFNNTIEVKENVSILFTKYNILDRYVCFVNKVDILAFQSWYATVSPPSNDKHWFPDGKQGHLVMRNVMNEDYNRIEKCLNDFGNFKRIIVSHFTPYNFRYGYTSMCGPMGLFENIIALGADVICLGHSHEYQNEIIEGCRIYNAGADYDEPKYLIFEV